MLEFYSGRKQVFSLNDKFWNNLVSQYLIVNTLLGEASKKLSRINMDKYNEDKKDYVLK